MLSAALFGLLLLIFTRISWTFHTGLSLHSSSAPGFPSLLRRRAFTAVIPIFGLRAGLPERDDVTALHATSSPRGFGDSDNVERSGAMFSHHSKEARDSPELSWSEDRVFQWVNSIVLLTEEEKKALKEEGLTGADLPEMTVGDWTDLGMSRSKARKMAKCVPKKNFAKKQVWINIGTKYEPNIVNVVLSGDGDVNKLIQRAGAVGLLSQGLLITSFENLEDGAQYDLAAAEVTRLNKEIKAIVDEQDEMRKVIKSRAEYLLPRLIKKATGLSIVYKGSEISFELDGKTAGDIDSLFVTDGQPPTHVIMERKRHAQSDVLEQMEGTLERYKKFVGQNVRIIPVLFAKAIPEAVIKHALEKGYFVLTEAMELRAPTGKHEEM